MCTFFGTNFLTASPSKKTLQMCAFIEASSHFFFFFCGRPPGIRALSGGGHSAFLLCKETPEQHNLADADEKQQYSFSNGPECHPLQEMLRFDAVVCLSQPVPRLRFRHHIQDLMNGDAGRFQLKWDRLAWLNRKKRDSQGVKHTHRAVGRTTSNTEFTIFKERWIATHDTWGDLNFSAYRFQPAGYFLTNRN